MAEFPALPLFTDALVADTSHLSNEEFGAYVRLMILTWRSPECRIPNDDAWIMRRVVATPEQFEAIHKPILNDYFSGNGNHLTQKRLQKEFEYLREQSKKQSARAKSRWNKEKEPCRGNAASGNAASGNAPTPTPTPTPNRLAKANPPPLPPGRAKPSVAESLAYLSSPDGLIEFTAYAQQHGIGCDVLLEIEKFKQYCLSGKGSYKDHKAAMRSWLLKRKEGTYENTQRIARRDDAAGHAAGAGGQPPQRSKWQVESDRLVEKYRREAEAEGAQPF